MFQTALTYWAGFTRTRAAEGVHRYCTLLTNIAQTQNCPDASATVLAWQNCERRSPLFTSTASAVKVLLAICRQHIIFMQRTHGILCRLSAQQRSSCWTRGFGSPGLQLSGGAGVQRDLYREGFESEQTCVFVKRRAPSSVSVRRFRAWIGCKRRHTCLIWRCFTCSYGLETPPSVEYLVLFAMTLVSVTYNDKQRLRWQCDH
jgi:hypothetical protein